jgi:hypothetical protein
MAATFSARRERLEEVATRPTSLVDINNDFEVSRNGWFELDCNLRSNILLCSRSRIIRSDLS